MVRCQRCNKFRKINFPKKTLIWIWGIFNVNNYLFEYLIRYFDFSCWSTFGKIVINFLLVHIVSHDLIIENWICVILSNLIYLSKDIYFILFNYFVASSVEISHCLNTDDSFSQECPVQIFVLVDVIFDKSSFEYFKWFFVILTTGRLCSHHTLCYFKCILAEQNIILNIINVTIFFFKTNFCPSDAYYFPRILQD